MNTFSTTLRRIFHTTSNASSLSESKLPELSPAELTVSESPDSASQAASIDSSEQSDATSANPAEGALVSRKTAWRILYSLMIPSILMPLTSSMSSVALPVIRDEFQLTADVTAWVPTAFTLPFMILMPVYGRLSDGVGRRRLILAGIVVCAIGTIMIYTSSNLAMLMAGRAIQGLGLAGMMPLGLAMISAIFPGSERGRAMGTWSSIGPVMGFLSPLMAGFIIDGWGWRMAYFPAIIMCVVAYFVVWRNIPAGLSNVRPDFWQTFDWGGVVLLASTLICLLFYLSSGPITGVAPLQDWRLLSGIFVLLALLLWWEQRHPTPFMPLKLFSNLAFTQGTLGAALRMVSMMSLFFSLPLYLVDVHDMSASQVGLMSMIMPGSMALMVRWAGGISDRWGSRRPVIIGFVVQFFVLLLFSRLGAESPMWMLVSLLSAHGMGVGLMLAPLHTAALSSISEEMMGTAAGFYSMVRFVGTAIGVAIAGVLIQQGLDGGLEAIEAYQQVYLSFTAVSLFAIIVMSFKVGDNKA